MSFKFHITTVRAFHLILFTFSQLSLNLELCAIAAHRESQWGERGAELKNYTNYIKFMVINFPFPSSMCPRGNQNFFEIVLITPDKLKNLLKLILSLNDIPTTQQKYKI